MTRESDAEVRAARDRDLGLYARDVSGEVGRREAVLLLHAFPLNGRMWEPVLGPLARSRRAIAPDLPGFGLSPGPDVPATLDGYAARVVRLLEGLGIERAIVVGASMGGSLALRLIEPLGERLRALVLVGARATAHDAEQAARRHEMAAEVESRGTIVAVDAFLPRILGDTTLRMRPDVVSAARAIALENASAGVAAALRALAGRPDSTPLLERFRGPVLFVVGEEDEITPPASIASLAERLPASRLHVVERAGHLPSFETPEAFLEAVERFLADGGPVDRS